MNLLGYLRQQDQGLGDTVKRVAEKAGLKPCDGCEKRRERLNEMFGYQRKKDKS